MAQRYVLWIGFNGQRFNGMAKAGNGASVGVVDFLNCLVPFVFKQHGISNVSMTPGSRTDSGVHVLRAPIMLNIQNSPYLIDEDKQQKTTILNQLNDVSSRLIEWPDMKFYDLHRVSNGFSLRQHVSYRRYVYRLRVAKSEDIYEKCKREPSLPCLMERSRSWTRNAGFDVRRAKELCDMFRGTMNMASFLKHTEGNRRKANKIVQISTTKTMSLVRLTAGEPWNSELVDENFHYYNFEVVSRSFLREQIRRMVRLVTWYAYGRCDRALVKSLFDYPDPRTFLDCGLTAAPGHGLYLVDVVYDPQQYENPIPPFLHHWDQEIAEEIKEANAGAEEQEEMLTATG